MELTDIVATTSGLIAAGYVITNLVALMGGSLTQEKLAMRSWVALVMVWWADGSGVLVAFWAAFAVGLAVIESFRR